MNQIGFSRKPDRTITLNNAIVENIAPGCTFVLNSSARSAILSFPAPPPGVSHDWWFYIVVTAIGGKVVYDETPTILYRQHGKNSLGTSISFWGRVQRACGQGARIFLEMLFGTANALKGNSLITKENSEVLDRITDLYSGSLLKNIAKILFPPIRKQRVLGKLLLRVWLFYGLYIYRR